MCICAPLSSNVKPPMGFPGEKSTKGGRGSGKTKTTKIYSYLLPMSAHPHCLALFPHSLQIPRPSSKLFANISSRMDLIWASMFMNLCLEEGAEFVYRRAWRSVMPGESCPLTFVSMSVARSSWKYAI